MVNAVTIVDRTADVVVDDRPWGKFEQLAINELCTVKVITVEPGQQLSLQRHRERDELWTVLDAGLQVQVDAHVWAAEVHERVWVPRGAEHRLANRGSERARVLEVAFGEFDEGDIERLEDAYGR